jgi:hypothetical protein
VNEAVTASMIADFHVQAAEHSHRISAAEGKGLMLRSRG